MALKRIPLTHFVDRSDRLRPKGLIRTADADGPFGLTSAMRNPMAESAYGDYLLVDFRPRDNWFISQNTEEVRGAAMDLLQPTDPTHTFGFLRCDNDGVYVNLEGSHPTEGPAAMNVHNSDVNNGLFSLERNTPNISVMVAAIRVISKSPSIDGSPGLSPLGYFNVGAKLAIGSLSNKINSTTFQPGIFSRAGQPGNGPIKGIPGDSTTSNINDNSVGKWILMQVIKDAANKATVRLAGGQFPDLVPRTNRSVEVGEDPDLTPQQVWAANTFRVPIRLQDEARLGFATMASYNSNLPNAPTTGEDQIDWNLFEVNHLCKEYPISGTRISFVCQDGVSWEVYRVSDNQWYRQAVNFTSWEWATSGVYYYQSTGAHTIDFIPGAQFSRIRPVLGNSGILRSVNRGILSSVVAGTP